MGGTFTRHDRGIASASKAKIKSRRMYSLFEHAKRHRQCDLNPIETAHLGAKRRERPTVLTLGEIRAAMLGSSRTNSAWPHVGLQVRKIVFSFGFKRRFAQWQGREPQSIAADASYGNGEFFAVVNGPRVFPRFGLKNGITH